MRRLVILFAAILIVLLVGAWYINQSDSTTVYTVAVYWLVCILFLVSAGNYLVYRWLNSALPWEKDALKRILIQLLVSGLYTIICANATYYLFKITLTDVPPDMQQMLLLNIYAVFIIIPVFSVFFGIYFLTKWKKATILIEEAKKETVRTELMALKNHIDPHFMFNNLNILSSLIDDENQGAQHFLEKFSDVYRYVLKTKDTDVSSLSDELDFLNSYIYLINTRFDRQVEFNISVDTESMQKHLPTLALQMLVENALKHNSFTRTNKLHVHIDSEMEYLIVKNNYQPKSSDSNGTGSGLKNIEKRYKLISQLQPEFSVVDDQYIAKIPLITLHG